MTYQHPQKHYAEREKVDVRTVRRWMKEDAPLDDLPKFAAWLACRKNVPNSTKDSLSYPPASTPSPAPDPSDHNTGAASALRRLEAEEVSAYKRLQAAIKSNVPQLIKLAREDWLKIGDSLRHYDLLVEQNRRDSGELYPRAELERILKALGWYLRMACVQASRSSAENFCGIKEPWAVDSLLTRIFNEQLLNAFAALASHSNGQLSVPGWAIKALGDDLETVLKNVPELTEARAKTFQDMVDFNARALSKQHRERLDKKK